MAFRGNVVIDMDAHILERADKFFNDHIDPEYRAPSTCSATASPAGEGGHATRCSGAPRR